MRKCDRTSSWPAEPKLAQHEATTAGTIRWIAGANSHTWATKAAARLRAQGQRVSIVDAAAVAVAGGAEANGTLGRERIVLGHAFRRGRDLGRGGACRRGLIRRTRSCSTPPTAAW